MSWRRERPSKNPKQEHPIRDSTLPHQTEEDDGEEEGAKDEDDDLEIDDEEVRHFVEVS